MPGHQFSKNMPLYEQPQTSSGFDSLSYLVLLFITQQLPLYNFRILSRILKAYYIDLQSFLDLNLIFPKLSVLFFSRLQSI